LDQQGPGGAPWGFPVYTLHLNSDAGYAVVPLTLLGAPVSSVCDEAPNLSLRDAHTPLTHSYEDLAARIAQSLDGTMSVNWTQNNTRRPHTFLNLSISDRVGAGGREGAPGLKGLRSSLDLKVMRLRFPKGPAGCRSGKLLSERRVGSA